MRKVTDQKLIDQVNRPENPVKNQQDPIMVIMPAYHKRIEAKDGVNNA
jgi:hypothetical protein